MKNKTYILNTLLAAVLGLVLLACQLVRTFAPLVIIPSLDVPNLVLLSLVVLVLDNYLAPKADRCYICKRLVFGQMMAQIRRHFPAAEIVDGTNLDDMQDYRPGRKALEELGIEDGDTVDIYNLEFEYQK